MRRLNPNIRPPGGFTFLDGGINFEAPSLEKLVDAVSSYRRRSSLPAGDPLAEITEYLCTKHPQYCQPGDPKDSLESVVNIVHRVSAKIKGWFKIANPEFVSDDVATVRFAICESCPHKIDWGTRCPPCKTQNAKILKHIFRPGTPFKQLDGQACLLAGDDLSAAVRLDKKHISNVVTEYEKCWRRRL